MGLTAFFRISSLNLEANQAQLLRLEGGLQTPTASKAKRRFHSLRHSIAVHLLDAGADVIFVRDRLGHANIQNTMVYLRYTTATRDAQTRRLFSSPHVV